VFSQVWLELNKCFAKLGAWFVSIVGTTSPPNCVPHAG
jgi:hypothetical protein